MNGGYILLTEKEEMWAKMLMQVLQDHKIACTALPVYGAGFDIRTGIQERLKIYVPFESHAQAADLLQELFSAEITWEE